MNKNIVRSILVLAMGCVCSTWTLAQEEQVPVPKTPTSEVVPDKNAKAKLLEKRRAMQATNAAKTKAQAQEKQRAAKARAEAIDINHASKPELNKLPGMTDAYADAIIAKRPYQTKAELVTKNAIPLNYYQTIRKLVAAK